MTILLSHRHDQLIDFTNNLLIYFVQKFGELYGDEFISHNIHSLLHLCDDFKNYGPLDNCSCFPFENFMQVLKKMVRSNAKPLKQVIKRYEEYLTFNKSHHENLTTCSTDFRKPHTDGPLMQDCSSPQFKIYSGNNVLINIKSSANCFIGGCINGSDLLIMKVLNICYNSVKKKNVFICKKINTIEPFYLKPINSMILGIACVSNLLDDYICIDVDGNWKKYLVLNIFDSNIQIAFPILHC